MDKMVQMTQSLWLCQGHNLKSYSDAVIIKKQFSLIRHFPSEVKTTV